MDLGIPHAATSELAAAFLQAAVTLGIALLCAFLYHRFHKPHFAWWSLAWTLYALRLGAIISFLETAGRHWLYWHQVATGWTALALLWAALVFSQQLRLRRFYLLVLLFPILWSYVAIYRLENFILAAGPAVLFLSAATIWTGWVFFRYHRQVGSPAAAGLALALLLWGLHHLDYPFLRARGAWVPWGYYLDLIFVLAMGLGILLLVLEDQHGGLATLSALSGDLRQGGRDDEDDMMNRLLQRPLRLPGVRGSAMYLMGEGAGVFVAGSGVCAAWAGREPEGTAGAAISRAIVSGSPEIMRDGRTSSSPQTIVYAYAAALPVFRGPDVRGALVIVGDARDPFTALDSRFLVTLGQQVGAALEGADLYRRLQERTVELERLASRMVRQHEAERSRLSRELHDETAQVLSAVQLQLGVMRESANADLARRLDRAMALMDTGIQGIRNVLNDLRPSLLDDLGLLPAMRALVHDFRERSRLDVELEAPDALPALPGEAELALFRALQEALANVARHAGARSVYVRLAEDDGRIALTVEDDGRGPPADAELHTLERKGHVGLPWMRERITALGGTVSLTERPGGGTRLRVTTGADRQAAE
jgi:signal transduction histidine kinase